jgi:hypothetical protein
MSWTQVRDFMRLSLVLNCYKKSEKITFDLSLFWQELSFKTFFKISITNEETVHVIRESWVENLEYNVNNVIKDINRMKY